MDPQTAGKDEGITKTIKSSPGCIPRWVVGWLIAVIFVMGLSIVELSWLVYNNANTIHELVKCQNVPANCLEGNK